ncbi:Hypothetical protein CINCED_3A013058 [Cinara cedri]|uniref:Uncharacterized protein n=1 Tax=Cinara cedri TaxID=506608 RepID=A0A5E4NSP2_9HEMI|nr:Hypothetical protein CINCED_3A013058 [Cinara cedri]
MVYLRKNGVWKIVGEVFRAMNESRPDDPIEYFRANMKPENDDCVYADQMRRKIAEDEEIMKRLKYDKVFLSDLLSERIHAKMKNSRLRGNIDDDYAEDNVMGETSFTDADHVE